MIQNNSFLRTICSGLLLLMFCLLTMIHSTNGQYEDVRCKCICPVPSVVSNNTNGTMRKLYIKNVAPDECNCDFVVLPQLTPDVQNKAKEFCPRCECKYESRDTSIIRFFVIFIIGVMSFLIVYMIFLMILDPWMHKRASRNSYKYFNEEVSMEDTQQHGGVPTGAGDTVNTTVGTISDSDDLNSTRHRVQSTSSIPSPENIPKGVLNRVGHSQTKWKRQVKEQRRNIFDNHTILN